MARAVSVGECVTEGAEPGPRVPLEDLREPEVQELHAPVVRHLDVRGLEVPVDDPLLVCRLQRLGDLTSQGQRFFEWKGAGREAHREVVPVDELHDEEMAGRGRGRTRDFFEGMDGGNPRMVQARQRAGFPLEAKPPLFVLEEFFRQYLDRDVPAELRVLRPVDLAHSARAEGREDLVRPQACAGRERHRVTEV